VRALNERWEVFGGLDWARDTFAGFESQTVASAGATDIAVDSERRLLTSDGGLTYTWEDRVSPELDVNFAEALVGLAWDWQISSTAKFPPRLMLYPTFDTSDDWRAVSLAALESAVNHWLALRLGLDPRYRNLPIGDAKSTDTTSSASVVLNV
jgi:putative salt-induced outer membrane protein YdiY